MAALPKERGKCVLESQTTLWTCEIYKNFVVEDSVGMLVSIETIV